MQLNNSFFFILRCRIPVKVPLNDSRQVRRQEIIVDCSKSRISPYNIVGQSKYPIILCFLLALNKLLQNPKWMKKLNKNEAPSAGPPRWSAWSPAGTRTAAQGLHSTPSSLSAPCSLQTDNPRQHTF